MVGLGPNAALLLGMIRIGKRTGYDIKRLVDVSTRFFWAASHAQIYPELKRLETAGLVRSREEPQGGRPRTVYSLTAEGERALHQWLTDHSSLILEQRNEALLKFFFADALTTAEAVELVRAMRAKHEAALDRIRKATPPYDRERRFGYLTWRYGLALNGWVIDWCKEMERELAEGPASERARGNEDVAAPAR